MTIAVRRISSIHSPVDGPTGLADGLAASCRYQGVIPGFAPEPALPAQWVPRSSRPGGGATGFGGLQVAGTVYNLAAARRHCFRSPMLVAAPRGATCSRGLSHAVKTYVATPSDRQRDWLLVDADGQTLGRLATQIADALRGKRKPTYTPHVDVGDFVVVVNAEKIAVTGDKRADKLYHRHSGYPGGLKTRTLNDMLERRPEEVIRLAVKGMLPRNRLSRKQLTKLKVYAGPDHPHAAQKPQPMETKS